jgi:hypothetical protein
VPNREFIFALELSDEPHFEAMLTDLTQAVLAHVGYQAAAIEELRGVVREALASGTAGRGRRCDLRFRVRAGELEITVSCADAPEWQTCRALP